MTKLTHWDCAVQPSMTAFEQILDAAGFVQTKHQRDHDGVTLRAVYHHPVLPGQRVIVTPTDDRVAWVHYERPQARGFGWRNKGFWQLGWDSSLLTAIIDRRRRMN
jgi:hypothetical protein